MRYCPICWSERRIRHAVADVRYWWKYKVKKEPEPSYAEVVKKIIQPLLTAMIGIRVIDELVKAMEEKDDRGTKGCVEAHKELR